MLDLFETFIRSHAVARRSMRHAFRQAQRLHDLGKGFGLGAGREAGQLHRIDEALVLGVTPAGLVRDQLNAQIRVRRERLCDRRRRRRLPPSAAESAPASASTAFLMRILSVSVVKGMAMGPRLELGHGSAV